MQGSGNRWELGLEHRLTQRQRGAVAQKEGLNAQGSSSSGDQEGDWPSRDAHRNSSQGCPRLGRP